MSIGEKIKRLRKAMGLTQTELGEKLGVKVNAVSKWECGRVEDIPTSKVKTMAAIFGVPTSYLIDDETEENPAPKIEGGPNRNIIKIAGRDGSFVERELTDDQVALMKNMLDQLKSIDDENL